MPDTGGPEQLANAVRDLIRWHYFAEELGRWSPGDGYQGVNDPDILLPLVGCVPTEVARLKSEGESWAELHKRLPCGDGPETWLEAREMLRNPLPERPQPGQQAPRHGHGKVVSRTVDGVCTDRSGDILSIARDAGQGPARAV